MSQGGVTHRQQQTTVKLFYFILGFKKIVYNFYLHLMSCLLVQWFQMIIQPSADP